MRKEKSPVNVFVCGSPLEVEPVEFSRISVHVCLLSPYLLFTAAGALAWWPRAASRALAAS